jgi:amino acid adenylation domain-containing protein
LTGLLQGYASEQADRRPDALALVMGDEHIRYGELESASNRLARLLSELGLEQGDRVCLCVPKSPAAVVAMLATLKAGGIYVPVDLASPAPRVARVFSAAEPTIVLALPEATKLLDGLAAEGVLGESVVIGSLAEPLEGERWASRFANGDAEPQDDSPLPSTTRPDDPAHLLFTSGSTGTPKGVVIKHSNVVSFVEWATSYFGTRAADRISGHPPLHFDLSTFDIYATLSAGAELHLVPPALNLLPHKLAAFIRDSELTQWFSVPSIMTYMAKFGAIRDNDFPSLERVLWCGEVLPTPILIHWMKRIPHARFTNLYGPTEATIASSYFTVREPPTAETEPIPIGTPCSGEELLVLGPDLSPVGPGEIGDLYIGGVGLSPGYWRDEEKTSAAFIPDPRSRNGSSRIYRTGDLAKVEEGVVYFLGRADSQIKSRGYRIELGEIETALNTLEELDECAVVGVESGGFEGTAICCAFATASGRDVDPPQVRERLAALLPAYMIPTRWLKLDVLPKNVNGKIDRKRLSERFGSEDGA